MTAMNIIVQPAAQTAWLLTDTASYDRSGTVSFFRPKVTTVRIGDHSFAAIATTGMSSQPNWHAQLRRLRVWTSHEFLSAIPATFRAVETELIEQGVPDACGHGHLSAVVAVFDREKAQARGYAISNDRSLFNEGRPGVRPYRPYTLQPVRKYLTRYVGQPFSPSADITDPKQWDPGAEAAALIEAQRADPFGLEGAQFSAVGGYALLSKIGSDGVDHTVVRRWPDRVGRRIDPIISDLTFADQVHSRLVSALIGQPATIQIGNNRMDLTPKLASAVASS